MKKKMAANAEKEKSAEQATSKLAEKPADKTDKASDKPSDKPADKPADKPKATEKQADKNKVPEKERIDKPAEKKEQEKKKQENGKGESSAKTDKPAPHVRPKQNGSSNGNTNGVNGTVSPESDSDELVVDDDETELFPELAYDDSDVEWEPGMDCPGRSLTRRSQVKATRTPETPRPASDKQETESKDSKVQKATDSGKDTPKDKKSDKSDAKADGKSSGKPDAKPDAKPSGKLDAKSDAKLSAKPDAKSDAKPSGKPDAKPSGKTEVKKADTPKKDVQDAKVDAKKDVKESPKKGDKKEEKSENVEVEVIVEIESSGESEESRKPDTNFSKSRVKVSPYRRSMRLADQTTSSVAANYTGNNTTMEMDITETSSFMDDPADDSYLNGLRAIKGRRSYKLLKDLPPRSAQANRSVRSVTSITVSEQSSRPTAPVVGRKRKPESEDNISIASEAEESPVAGKRQRLLDRLARPFRRTVLMPARRNAEIVGINSDLPLSAPVASTSSWDPETLKTGTDVPPAPPVVVAAPQEDAKRCVVM